MTSMTRRAPRGGVETSEWVNLETKAVDNVGLSAKTKIVVPQLGRKGKMRKKGVVLHIPRAFVPEVKRWFSAAFWDQETLDAPSATASSYNFFSQIAQGDAVVNRQGDAIFVQKMVLRIFLTQSPSITNANVTMQVVMDKEPAAGSPAWGDMFQGIGGGSTDVYQVVIPNYDKRHRFNYLDRLGVPLHWAAAYYSGAAVVSVEPKLFTIVIPVNRKVRYDGTNPRPYSGAEMMLWAWSDVTSNTPKCTASAEVFFTDV